MLFFANGIDLPKWACEEVEARSRSLGVSPDELLRFLVCTHTKEEPKASDAQFAVPRSMESRLIGDDFMVVRRTENETVLAPTVAMSFADSVSQFQANGCTETDVLHTLSR